jgi:transcriptional regulator with XRE-family HTH domain
MSTITDQLRQAILNCGMSRYELSKRTGVDQAALSRFMHGQCGLLTTTLDRLCPVLGLELVPAKQARRNTHGKSRTST